MDSMVADKRAEEALRSLAEHFGLIGSFSMRLVNTTSTEAQDTNISHTSVMDFALQKPDKVSVRIRSEEGGALVVSDGTTAFYFIEKAKAYRQVDRPDSFEALFSDPEFTIITGGFVRLSLLQHLLAREPYTLLTAEMTDLEYQGQRELGDAICHHLRFNTKRSITDLWLSQSDRPVPKMLVSDISKSFAGFASQGVLPPEWAGLKMTATVSYGDFNPKADLDPELFRFVVPHDARRVDSFLQIGDQQSKNPLVGKKAPRFALKLVDGQEIKFAGESLDSILVLDFWATWCSPCKRGLPVVAEIADEFKKRGVRFIAVNLQEAKEKVEAFLEEEKLELEAALDPDGQTANLFEVKSIPQTIILDRAGTIFNVHVGLAPDFKERLRRDLETVTAAVNL